MSIEKQTLTRRSGKKKEKSIIRNALVALFVHLYFSLSLSLARCSAKRNHKLCVCAFFCKKINGSAAKCFKMKSMSAEAWKRRRTARKATHNILHHVDASATQRWMLRHFSPCGSIGAVITKGPANVLDAIEKKWSTLTVFICTINLQCLIGRNPKSIPSRAGSDKEGRENR